MRTRAVVLILTAGLAASVGPGGCQVLAGLTVLEAGSGGAGAGGATSGSSTHGSGTTSSSHGSSSSGPAGSSSGMMGCPGGAGGGPTNTTASSGGPSCWGDGMPGNWDAVDGGTCMCPMCTGNVCTPFCGPGCPTGLHSDVGATKMQCEEDGGCANQVFTCDGTYLCELDCNGMNACSGTTLQCSDAGGPCRITCGGMACGMGTQIICGPGACDVKYLAPTDCPSPVAWKCNDSCWCTHQDTM